MILDEFLSIFKNKRENVAYVIGSKSYTYADLYKYVCNIYSFLLKQNKEKKPVIVYGHKEVFMKATFLACSYAGMAYVPIDNSMPGKRVKEIIEQVEHELIIGDTENGISKKEIENIMKQENYNEIKKIYMRPEDIYYIIFTSGSTGKPKGVKVSYNNLNSCVNWLKDITNAKDEIILNQANFSFDLSVADFYLSLITGSTHYILENTSKLDFEVVFEQLQKSNITIAVMTPSFADLLLLDKSFCKEKIPLLKKIIFCGEKLQISTAKKLFTRFENLEIINCYGPTECTFAVTSIGFKKNDLDEKEISVGIPKNDVKIHIVDKDLKVLPDNRKGEILITGKSVAQGYLGNVRKNTFIKYNGEDGYLTGDLGFIKDGLLYCSGRKDKQIKYKGYRIELSDIKKNLEHLEYIEKAVVLPKKNEDGKVLNIIAFVKVKTSSNNTNEIKQDLKQKLPDYMIPKIKIINEFPINNNGKCDEKKLLEEY